MVAPELGAAHLPRPEPAGDQLAGRLGAARDDGFVGRGRELDLLSAALTGTLGRPGDVRPRPGRDRQDDPAGRDGAAHPWRWPAARPTWTPATSSARPRPCSRPSRNGRSTTRRPCCWWTATSCWLRSTGGSGPSSCPRGPRARSPSSRDARRPRPAWWLDPGWRRLVSVHRLDELDDADSRDLLLGLGVTDQVEPAGAARPRLSAGPGHAGRGGPVRSPTGSAVRRPRRRRSAVRPDPGRRPRRGAPDRAGHLRARHPDDPGPAHPDDRDPRAARCGPGWSRGRTSGAERSGCTCTTSYGSCSRRSWRTARRPSTSSCTGRSAATSWIGWPTRPNRIPIGRPRRSLLLHRKTPLAAQTSLLRDRGQLSVPRAGPAEREEIVGPDRGQRGTRSRRPWRGAGSRPSRAAPTTVGPTPGRRRSRSRCTCPDRPT